MDSHLENKFHHIDSLGNEYQYIQCLFQFSMQTLSHTEPKDGLQSLIQLEQ